MRTAVRTALVSLLVSAVAQAADPTSPTVRTTVDELETALKNGLTQVPARLTEMPKDIEGLVFASRKRLDAIRERLQMAERDRLEHARLDRIQTESAQKADAAIEQDVQRLEQLVQKIRGRSEKQIRELRIQGGLPVRRGSPQESTP